MGGGQRLLLLYALLSISSDGARIDLLRRSRIAQLAIHQHRRSNPLLLARLLVSFRLHRLEHQHWKRSDWKRRQLASPLLPQTSSRLTFDEQDLDCCPWLRLERSNLLFRHFPTLFRPSAFEPQGRRRQLPIHLRDQLWYSFEPSRLCRTILGGFVLWSESIRFLNFSTFRLELIFVVREILGTWPLSPPLSNFISPSRLGTPLDSSTSPRLRFHSSKRSDPFLDWVPSLETPTNTSLSLLPFELTLMDCESLRCLSLSSKLIFPLFSSVALVQKYVGPNGGLAEQYTR